MFKKTKKCIGLEISSDVIRVLEVVFKGEEWQINGANEIRLAPGIVEGGVIKDRRALAKLLKAALGDAKPKAIRGKTVHFALPEELLDIHVFKVELTVGKGIKQVIEKELSRFGAEREGFEYAFRVIDTKRGHGYSQISSVVLASSKKDSLLHWQSFFSSIGLKAEFFDTAKLAAYRGFFEERQNYNLGILHVGNAGTTLALFGCNGLEYEAAFSAGLSLIASDFEGSYEPAGEFLAQRGIGEGERSEELDILLGEIGKALEQAGSQMVNERGEISGANIVAKKILLCGEGANVPGLKDRFAAAFPALEFFESNVRGFSDRTGMVYAVTVGLALRGQENGWDKSDPLLAAADQSFSLKRSIESGKGSIGNLMSFLKKLVFFPLFIAIIIFGVWLLSGAISTSWENNKKNDIPQGPAAAQNAEDRKAGEPLAVPDEAAKADREPLASSTAKSAAKATSSAVKSGTSAVLPKAAAKQGLLVNSDIGRPLNVRKGPGTSYELIGEAAEGSELVMLEEKSGWYRIEWKGGGSAWVNGEYVRKK